MFHVRDILRAAFTRRQPQPQPSDPPPRAAAAPVTYTQPDLRFGGPAYQYLRASDELPDHDSLPAPSEQLCKVKLFLAAGRFTYYVAAATDYDGAIILTGYMVSPLGPDCDEFGDCSMDELAGVRALGLPIERDLTFTPLPRTEIEASVADGRTP